MRNAGLLFTAFGMALIVAEAVRQIDAAFVELTPLPRPQPALPATGPDDNAGSVLSGSQQ